MANTYFIDGLTPVVASWLNDINNYVYGTTPVQRHRGTVTSIGGTIFTVPFTFTKDANDVDVYISGVHQILDDSYVENSDNTITFSEAVLAGLVVEFVGN